MVTKKMITLLIDEHIQLICSCQTNIIMKPILTILLLLLINFAFAQAPSLGTEPDQRLYEVYEADYIKRLLTENPFLIKRWNYYLDHAYQIIDAVPGKTDGRPEVIIPDLDNINILLLEKEQGLTHDYNIPVIYNIKNTKKCLVYLPGKTFSEELKKNIK
jgi:hypothetical protein